MKRKKIVQLGSCRKHNDLVVVLSRDVAFGATACVLIVVWSTVPLTMIGPSLNFVGWYSLGKRSVDVDAVFCDLCEAEYLVETFRSSACRNRIGMWLSVIKTCSLCKDRTGRVPR